MDVSRTTKLPEGKRPLPADAAVLADDGVVGRFLGREGQGAVDGLGHGTRSQRLLGPSKSFPVQPYGDLGLRHVLRSSAFVGRYKSVANSRRAARSGHFCHRAYARAAASRMAAGERPASFPSTTEIGRAHV